MLGGEKIAKKGNKHTTTYGILLFCNLRRMWILMLGLKSVQFKKVALFEFTVF